MTNQTQGASSTVSFLREGMEIPKHLADILESVGEENINADGMRRRPLLLDNNHLADDDARVNYINNVKKRGAELGADYAKEISYMVYDSESKTNPEGQPINTICGGSVKFFKIKNRKL